MGKKGKKVAIIGVYRKRSVTVSTVGTRKKKPKKEKPEKIDGFSPDDAKKLRTAIRQVWQWSYPRKLCIARATGKDGFPRCEQCRKKVPKVYPDHIDPVGEFNVGFFIDRMFRPSKELQALCKKCHGEKTKQENADRKFAKAMGK